MLALIKVIGNDHLKVIDQFLLCKSYLRKIILFCIMDLTSSYPGWIKSPHVVTYYT